MSYNGDLRGVVEEKFRRKRRVRCSVASLGSIGAVVDGSRLVATIPIIFGEQILALRPHLRVSPIPFPHEPGDIDLLRPTALDGDPACYFLRDAIIRIADARTRRARWPARLAPSSSTPMPALGRR